MCKKQTNKQQILIRAELHLNLIILNNDNGVVIDLDEIVMFLFKRKIPQIGIPNLDQKSVLLNPRHKKRHIFYTIPPENAFHKKSSRNKSLTIGNPQRTQIPQRTN